MPILKNSPHTANSTLEVIGKTPVVRLQNIVPEGSADIVVKLEYFNPTGSYKDRMALSMIEEAEKRGDLKPGMTVVEWTGGSTGSSLAFVCAVKGYPFKVVSSDAYANEKLQTMVAFGADLHVEPSDGGKITPDLFDRMFAKAEELTKATNGYWTNQLNNGDSLIGYRGIGRELLAQLDQPLDAFCGMVGTGGMIMGVSAELRLANPDTMIVALEPATSPAISKGYNGPHTVDGTGIGFVPPLVDKSQFNDARGIDEQEGRAMARRLATEEGIFGGTSTGLNVVGALQLARELGPGKTVATVACDFGLKYLAGDLYSI
ncbi:MAG: PLP-dependent cysteine synthase family protein [Anaerolineae bacterium]